MEELSKHQKILVANNLEHYEGSWLSEYQKGCIMGFFIGMFTAAALLLSIF